MELPASAELLSVALMRASDHNTADVVRVGVRVVKHSGPWLRLLLELLQPKFTPQMFVFKLLACSRHDAFVFTCRIIGGNLVL